MGEEEPKKHITEICERLNRSDPEVLDSLAGAIDRLQKAFPRRGHFLMEFIQNADDAREKLREACRAFDCEPWIGVYVETTEYAHVFLTSLRNYDKKYRGKKGKVIEDWKMKRNNIKEYEKDSEVKHIRLAFDLAGWDFSW